jgi:predicted nucleic acid-binding Zn ribbon protein
VEPVGKILRRVLKEHGLDRPKELKEIEIAWRDVAGPDVSAETSVLSFRKGVLTIGVSSAPLLSELTTYQREELLAALRARLPEPTVQDLGFRLR